MRRPLPTHRHALMTCALAASFALAACGPQGDDATASKDASAGAGTAQAAPARQAAVRPAPRGDYGAVERVEPIVSNPSATGAGAVIGGVLGGVLGHQVGSGNGKKAATVVGAVGGAVAGNAVEKHRSQTVTGYRVQVRLETGESRQFEQPGSSGLQVGDRVRVVGGSLQQV